MITDRSRFASLNINPSTKDNTEIAIIIKLAIFNGANLCAYSDIILLDTLNIAVSLAAAKMPTVITFSISLLPSVTQYNAWLTGGIQNSKESNMPHTINIP